MRPKIIFIAIFFTWLPFWGMSQTSLVQFINNAADSVLGSVDVWVDSVKVAEDLDFRVSTPYLLLEANVPHHIYITHPDSNDTNYATGVFIRTFQSTQSYVAMLNGIASTSDYTPAPPLALHTFEGTRQTSEAGGYTDVLFYNGVTDAEAFDFIETTLLQATITSHLAYAEFSSYQALESFNYRISVRDSLTGNVIRQYRADLASAGLEDSAITLIASGFMDPGSNNNGPAFGLYYAGTAGGALVPLPQSFASVQVIHNCPDSALAALDVYAGGSLLVNNLAFRHASSYLGFPSGVDLQVEVARDTSSGAGNGLLNTTVQFNADEQYFIVINGLVTNGYQPYHPLEMIIRPSHTEAALGYNTDVIMVHGSTDAPSLRVMETNLLNMPLVDGIAYGDHTSYEEWPSALYSIDVTTQSNPEPIVRYTANFASEDYAGKALVMLASGFLNPAANFNGPSFGLWLAKPAGGTLVELDHLSGIPEAVSQDAEVYPNPASLSVLMPREGHVRIHDTTGRLCFEGLTRNGQIDISRVPEGFYHVLLLDETGYSSHPLVIRR